MIAAGLIAAVFLLEVGLRLAGSAYLTFQDLRNRDSLQNYFGYRILCLGESTTACGGDFSWPRQLERILNRRTSASGCSVINRAVPSTDTSAILAQVSSYIEKYRPKMIITMMGINDSRQARSYAPFHEGRPLALRRLKVVKLFRLFCLHLSKSPLVSAFRKAVWKIRIKSRVPKDASSGEGHAAVGTPETVSQRGKELAVAVRKNPENLPLLMELAVEFRNHGQYRQAIDILQKACDIDSGNYWVWLEFGRCYDGLEQQEKAVRMLEQAIEVDPDHPAAYTGLGTCLRKMKRHDEALRLFETAARLDPSDSWCLLEAGRNEMDRGNEEQAVKYISAAVKNNPVNYQAIRELGSCLILLERLSEAETVLRRTVENLNLVSRSDPAWSRLCLSPAGREILISIFMELERSLELQGKWDEADKIYDGLIRLFSDEEDIYQIVGSLYRENNRYQEAMATFAAGLRAFPGSDQLRLELSWLLRKQGYYDEALLMAEEALEIRESERAYVELGYCLRIQRKHREAVRVFERLLTLDKDNADAYYGLGLYYRDVRDYSQAEVMFSKVIELEPAHEGGYIELASCLRSQGKYGRAKSAYEKLAEYDPERAYAGLAVLSSESNEHEQALDYFREAENRREDFQRTVTAMNYRALQRICREKDIILVCVSYPSTGISSVREALSADDKVIFVDNENVFKDAVRKNGYKTYFMDNFAGAFGHCNDEGNRLLADNIARVLLETLFRKE